MLDLAERALGHLDGDGQATIIRERSLQTRFARSAPTQATAVDDITVHLLAWRNGHCGAATTNVTSDEALRSAAVRAQAAAAAAASAGAGLHPGLPSPAGAYPEHGGFDAETAVLDPALAGAALRAAFAAAVGSSSEAFGFWTAGDVETTIASSAGVRAADRVTDAYLKIVLRDAGGRSGWGAGAASAAGAIDPEAIAARAARLLPRGDLAELAPGEYPAVLAPDAVGALLDFLGGLAFDGLAHAEGRGALVDRLGTQVAAPIIDLADEPSSPATLPRASDFEGVAKRPLPLIAGGVAQQVAHDLRSAALAGSESTGHALAPGGSPYGVQPANLVLAGGHAADAAALAAPIERGIYVTRLWYMNPVRPNETVVTATTRDGTYLIEDGAISRPLRDVRMTDSILGILERTEALTAACELVSEADFYGRRFATGVVCPALRTGALRITG